MGDLLSHSHSVEMKLNADMLLVILESLQYLSRQNIPIRGHKDKESNFIQLLQLRSHDNKVSVKCIGS